MSYEKAIMTYSRYIIAIIILESRSTHYKRKSH